MAANIVIISFFVTSAIVTVESQVCTQLQTVEITSRDSTPSNAIVSFSDYCLNDDEYDDNYGDEYVCTKTKWEMVYKTRTEWVPRTIKLCCPGYHQVSSRQPTIDIICEPDVISTTTRVSSKSTVTEPSRSTTAATPSMTSTMSRTNSELKHTTRQSPVERTSTWTTEVDVHSSNEPFETELTSTITDYTLVQSTVTTSPADIKGHASELSWMKQYWTFVILPVVVIILIAFLVIVAVWRWTFIKLFLSAKYNVNGNKAKNENSSKKAESEIPQMTTLEMNCDIPLDKEN